MTFELYTAENKLYIPQEIISYEIVSDISAACDGLSLYYRAADIPEEFIRVCVKDNGKTVFYGFADKQKTTADENGFIDYIYARSSAMLLVDNEANPCQFNCPSSEQLWLHYAEEFSVKNGLPPVSFDGSYYVQKGTSCFKAINDFMKYVNGTGIYVTPDNVLTAFEKSADCKSLDGCEIISASRINDRSEIISSIDYKINSTDKYIYHLESGYAVRNMIRRRKLTNLSALPVWQREACASFQIKNPLMLSKTVEVVFAGSPEFSLYDRAVLNINRLGISGDEYIVSQVIKQKNEKGTKTTVVFNKEIDGELINYVAE